MLAPAFDRHVVFDEDEIRLGYRLHKVRNAFLSRHRRWHKAPLVKGRYFPCRQDNTLLIKITVQKSTILKLKGFYPRRLISNSPATHLNTEMNEIWLMRTRERHEPEILFSCGESYPGPSAWNDL